MRSRVIPSVLMSREERIGLRISRLPLLMARRAEFCLL
jgi:hypothetical protein